MPARRGRSDYHGPYRSGHNVHTAAWRRCVRAVTIAGTAASPEAVCTKALGRKAFLPKRPSRRRR